MDDARCHRACTNLMSPVSERYSQLMRAYETVIGIKTKNTAHA